MRKKKKLTPTPVEVDFYAEALKAFDAPIPVSQEEEELLRQRAMQKKLRRRRTLCGIVSAVAVLCTVVLLLWRPWETRKPDMPMVSWPPAGQKADSIYFYLEKSPGNPAVSYQPVSAEVELSEELSDSLRTQLEELKWSSTLILSSIPVPVGGFYLTTDNLDLEVGDLWYDGGQNTIFEFDAYGRLFHNGYMAKADEALWAELMSLLQRASFEVTAGDFAATLEDGGRASLGIGSDGTFRLQTECIDVSGKCARIHEFLILSAKVDKRYGIIVFEIGSDGSLSYSPAHSFRNLADLGNTAVFCEVLDTAPAFASAVVALNMPGTGQGISAVRDISQEQLSVMVDILSHVEWLNTGVDSIQIDAVGSVTLQLAGDTLDEATEQIQFSQLGYILYEDQLGRLSTEDWRSFVELLDQIVGIENQQGAYHAFLEDGNSILLEFDGSSFRYWSTLDHVNGAVKGSCLCFGAILLLAGEDDFSLMLLYDYEDNTFTGQDGTIYNRGYLYGDTENNAP